MMWAGYYGCTGLEPVGAESHGCGDGAHDGRSYREQRETCSETCSEMRFVDYDSDTALRFRYDAFDDAFDRSKL
eukprot:2300901-Prymnesium_polylepis.1